MNLFLRRKISDLQAEVVEDHSLRRALGPLNLTTLGIGAVIGAGIFVLSGLGAHYAGPGLMLSFVMSGLGRLFSPLFWRASPADWPASATRSFLP